MAVKNALAGVAVSDLDRAVSWYRKILGRQPDKRPMENEVEYRFESGGWAQLFVDPDRAGKSSITLVVDDIDQQVSLLRDAGLDAGEPDRSDYADTLIVHDPDGNQVVFAQAKTPDNRSAHE